MISLQILRRLKVRACGRCLVPSIKVRACGRCLVPSIKVYNKIIKNIYFLSNLIVNDKVKLPLT